jgi:hypothetical protein
LEKIIPENTKKAYSVQGLLDAVHPDNEKEGERMRVAVQADKEEGRLKAALKSANKFLELKPNLFGIGGDFNAFFDYILNKRE